MSDRITGLIVAVLALAFFAGASQLESPFFADPVGPKTFPYIIAAIAFARLVVVALDRDRDRCLGRGEALVGRRVAERVERRAH